MPDFRDISIQRKLKLILVLALGVALLLACSAFVAHDLITFRQSMVRDLSTLAQMIERNSTASLAFGDRADALEVLSALQAKSPIVTAVIYQRDGTELARYDRHAGSPRATPSQVGEGHRFTGAHLEFLHAVRLENETIGEVWLRSDLSELDSRWRRYVITVAVVMLAAMLVAFSVSSRLLKTVSAPILDLAETARQVAAGKNYSLRAAAHGRDELGMLVEVFNGMLTQIQQRDASLQKAHDELEQRVESRTRALRQEVVERKQAEKAIEQQLARISLINHITRAVSERQNLQSILHEVLRQLERHLPADFGTVLLMDRREERIEPAAVRARPGAGDSRQSLAGQTRTDFENSLLAPCLEGRSVYFDDTLKASDFWTAQLAVMDLRSAVVVPLRVETRLFGLLVAARQGAGAFGSGECEFLRMLSEQVALAAHQARLYSELQAAYEELRQTQHAVTQHERLRALGQMASGIAHDINNTLSPVVGFSDLLLQDGRQLDDSTRRYLEHIRTAGQDVAHIVARLREFYRRRDDRQDLEPVQCTRIIEQVIELTRPRWRDISQERGVVFSV